MWQITLEELLTDSVKPVKTLIHVGSWGYECPICGDFVGLYRTDEGMMLKREACRNGHKVRWEKNEQQE